MFKFSSFKEGRKTHMWRSLPVAPETLRAHWKISVYCSDNSQEHWQVLVSLLSNPLITILLSHPWLNWLLQHNLLPYFLSDEENVSLSRVQMGTDVFSYKLRSTWLRTQTRFCHICNTKIFQRAGFNSIVASCTIVRAAPRWLGEMWQKPQ